jgi:hypothetical protein
MKLEAYWILIDLAQTYNIEEINLIIGLKSSI